MSASRWRWWSPRAGASPRTRRRWWSSISTRCRRCSIRCDGLAPGAPKARLDCPDNLVARHSDRLRRRRWRLRAAPRIGFPSVSASTRAAAMSIEPRGVLARFDAAEDMLTVWDDTQMPHRAKAVLVEALGPRRASGARGRARRRRRLRPEGRVSSRGAGGAGGRDAARPRRSNGSRTGARISSPPRQERARTGTMEAAFDADGRLLRASAAGSATITAPRRPMAWRCPTTPRPIWSGPMCCRPIGIDIDLLPDQPGAGSADARRRAAAGHLS